MCEHILIKSFKDFFSVYQGPAIGFINMPHMAYGFKRIVIQALAEDHRSDKNTLISCFYCFFRKEKFIPIHNLIHKQSG